MQYRPDELDRIQWTLRLDEFGGMVLVSEVDIDDGMVDEIVSNAWEVVDNRNIMFVQFCGWANTGQQEDLKDTNTLATINNEV